MKRTFTLLAMIFIALTSIDLLSAAGKQKEIKNPQFAEFLEGFKVMDLPYEIKDIDDLFRFWGAEEPISAELTSSPDTELIPDSMIVKFIDPEHKVEEQKCVLDDAHFYGMKYFCEDFIGVIYTIFSEGASLTATSQIVLITYNYDGSVISELGIAGMYFGATPLGINPVGSWSYTLFSVWPDSIKQKHYSYEYRYGPEETEVTKADSSYSRIMINKGKVDFTD
ncbi:MAG: hypothetical protein WC212_00325 [Candidatus Delongbacteria bacterium]